MDRRAFLRQSGPSAGGLGRRRSLPLGRVKRAEAATAPVAGDVKRIKNTCTHCSVGCTVTAEVVNGVWVGQEPRSIADQSRHCAKGAAIREVTTVTVA